MTQILNIDCGFGGFCVIIISYLDKISDCIGSIFYFIFPKKMLREFVDSITTQ